MIVRATYNSQTATHGVHADDATSRELMQVAVQAPARANVDVDHPMSRRVQYEWDVVKRDEADLLVLRLKNVYGVSAEIVG